MSLAPAHRESNQHISHTFGFWDGHLVFYRCIRVLGIFLPQPLREISLAFSVQGTFWVLPVVASARRVVCKMGCPDQPSADDHRLVTQLTDTVSALERCTGVLYCSDVNSFPCLSMFGYEWHCYFVPSVDT